ncbi:integrase [Pandoraea sputorum]
MANFTKDQTVFRGGGKFRIVRIQNDVAQLENTVTGEFSSHDEADLLEEYVKGYLRTINTKEYQRTPRPNSISDLARAANGGKARGDFETRRRVNYLVKLDRMGAFESSRSALREAIHAVSVEIADAIAPHESTVYRWRRRYRLAHCDIRALLDQSARRGGRGNSRLDPIVEGIIHEKIETTFLNGKRGSPEEVFNAIFLEIQRQNTTRIESEWFKVPGLRTIQRRIKEIDAYDLAIARFGLREANRRYADQRRARQVSRILEIVELDHTPVDLIVTNEHGVSIGRPMFTVVIDRYSRCVLGYCLSLAGHGVHAVFEALRHAMMPKSYLGDAYPDLNLAWPCHGWPERLLMDNGREMHAYAVVDALTNLGVICEYAASQTPNDKPFVERFIKTFNYSFIHKLPGTTLAKIGDRIGFKAEDEACLTLEKLNEMAHTWITSVYHVRPHRGLNGRTPLDVWKESAAVFPPQLKCNAEDLSIEFGSYTECAVQHYGIDLNAFVYSSSELLALRRMLPAKQKVHVKAPFENAGQIWVWNPIESRYFAAYNKDDRYVGLTIEQAKALRKLSKPLDAHQRTRASAEEQIREQSLEAMRAKELKTRKLGARQAHITSKSFNRPQLPAPELAPIQAPISPVGDDELYEFAVDVSGEGGRNDS